MAPAAATTIIKVARISAAAAPLDVGNGSACWNYRRYPLPYPHRKFSLMNDSAPQRLAPSAKFKRILADVAFGIGIKGYGLQRGVIQPAMPCIWAQDISHWFRIWKPPLWPAI